MSKEKIIKVCDKIIEWSFYVLLVAVSFSTSLVEIFSTAMILAWIIKKVIEKDLKWTKLIPVKILFLLWLWTIISCFNTNYPKESFRGIFKVIEYSLIFIIAATSLKEEYIKKFIYVITAGILFVSFNGFFQFFTGHTLVRHRLLIANDEFHRISSTFIHPNDFGAYLLVILIIFISILLSNANKPKIKLVVILPAVLSLISLFLTKSRGAWLSFAASLLTFGALRAKKMAAIFFALLLAIFIMLPYTIQRHIISAADLKEGTTRERIILWKGTIDMIKEHPIIGFGINTYSRNFPRYKAPEYPDVRYTHNCYLHMASEIGIIGALFFLLFLASVFILSIKGILLMPSGLSRDLSRGLVAGLIGFSLNSAIDTHLYSVTLSVFFYLLLGFCFALSCHATKT